MTTTNLNLPYIQAGQAQKHVTHNEALRALDAIVHLSVVDRSLSAPPGSPVEGARYLVAASPTGSWSGHTGAIAAWQDGAWAFHTPRQGWTAWVADEAMLIAFNGSSWVDVGASASVPLLGINGTADTTNRLVVKSAASLFDNVGNGHQHKINKAVAADTASLLFQTGFSGRAEMGTTGDDKFHVKVSPDGTTWHDVLIIDTSGQVGIGATPLASPQAGVLVERAGGILAAFVNADASTTTGGAGMVGYYKNTPSAATRLGYLLFGSRGGGGSAANAAGMLGYADAAWTMGSDQSAHVRFETTPSGSATRAERLRIESGGTVRPGADNAQTLGSSSFRWSAVHAVNGTIQTSDARDKTVVGDLGFAGDMVDAVEPRLFRWKVGGYRLVASATETTVDDDGKAIARLVPAPAAGARTHAGFIAQDLRAAMEAIGTDFAAWGLDDKDNPASRQWTRPDQLIAVLWAALRQTRAEVERLSQAVEALGR